MKAYIDGHAIGNSEGLQKRRMSCVDGQSFGVATLNLNVDIGYHSHTFLIGQLSHAKMPFRCAKTGKKFMNFAPL